MKIKNVDPEECKRRKMIHKIKCRIKDSGYGSYINWFDTNNFPEYITLNIVVPYKNKIKDAIFGPKSEFYFDYDSKTFTITVSVQAKNYCEISNIVRDLFDDIDGLNVILIKNYCEE